MSISLAGTLPLRKTTDWPFYKTVEVLPHIYGKVTLTPIQYSKDQRWFLLADHPIQTVHSVKVNGKEVKSYQLHNQSDYVGYPVSLLELLDSSDPSQIKVTLTGKIDSSGEVIKNPADILYDILVTLCKIPTAYTRLTNFKSECISNNIELAGVLNDPSTSVRNQISSIMESIGAVWSLGTNQIATLYPVNNRPVGVPVRLGLTRLLIDNLQSESSLDDIYTIIAYSYSQDWSSHKPQETITLKSSTSESYGEITKTVNAPWVSSPKAALSIANRLLEYYSRPVWTISFDAEGEGIIDLAPSDWIGVYHALIPTPETEFFIQDAQCNITDLTSHIVVETPVGELPFINFVQKSVSYDDAVTETNYSYVDGVLTLTVLNSEGAPLKNASVAIAGQTQVTNAYGIVKFKLDQGTYTVTITATGYSSTTLEITL